MKRINMTTILKKIAFLAVLCTCCWAYWFLTLKTFTHTEIHSDGSYTVSEKKWSGERHGMRYDYNKDNVLISKIRWANDVWMESEFYHDQGGLKEWSGINDDGSREEHKCYDEDGNLTLWYIIHRIKDDVSIEFLFDANKTP